MLNLPMGACASGLRLATYFCHGPNKKTAPLAPAGGAESKPIPRSAVLRTRYPSTVPDTDDPNDQCFAKLMRKIGTSTTPPAPVDVLQKGGRIAPPCDVFPNPQCDLYL